MRGELGAVPQLVELEVGEDVFAEVDAVAFRAGHREEFVRVELQRFVLVVFVDDDLLDRHGVADDDGELVADEAEDDVHSLITLAYL